MSPSSHDHDDVTTDVADDAPIDVADATETLTAPEPPPTGARLASPAGLHPPRSTDAPDPTWAAPAASTAAATVPYGTRPGDLTLQWRLLVGAAWVATFFAYSAVWQASVQIGIGTWWLGPRAQPTSVLVRVLPFVLCITMALCALYNVARLLRVCALGVALAVLLAVPDFSRSVGLGVAELTIACLVGLVVAAAATGRYRVVPVTSEHSDATAAPHEPIAAPPIARPTAPTDAGGH